MEKPKIVWYKRKDGTEVMKAGNWKVLEIFKKDKRFYNGEYSFYRVLVFKKGKVISAEGVHGSSLRKKYQAVRWGCNKAREFKLIK